MPMAHLLDPDDPVGLGEQRDLAVKGVVQVVRPAVEQHERLALAIFLVIQRVAIDLDSLTGRHSCPLNHGWIWRPGLLLNRLSLAWMP
jgi:hypothetical protein